MIILTLFAFLGGVVTILSPCILPIMPIILGGGVTGGRSKPYGVVVGFVSSFVIFTLSLSAIVKLTGLPSGALRNLSVVIIILMGLSLLVPKIQLIFEKIMSRFTSMLPSQAGKSGLLGGYLLGLSLGLIWTPCVGPIIASVITLAATSSVNASAIILTISYALGTAIPMFIIILMGRQALQKFSFLSSNTQTIQKSFGIVMILVAIGIYTNIDRNFQTFVLETFPNYGTGLISLEDNDLVKNQLKTSLQTDQVESQNEDALSIFQNSSYSQAPEIIAGGEWLNTEKPLSLGGLRGKVVLIDFWTYTCINCIRTLPYLKQWHEKYQDAGLVIIGVHTPEFEFEKDPANVKQFIEQNEITYPVVQDNEFATWRAYDNIYWPAKYLIDASGRIRYNHFGEGKYEETEREIQKLLQEAGQLSVNPSDTVVKDPKQSTASRTPEIYLGYKRLEYYDGVSPVKNGETTHYEAPPSPSLHHFSLQGDFQVNAEYLVARSGSELTLRYFGKEVFLVMKKSGVESSKVLVEIDGEPIQASLSGKDVVDSMVYVDSDRLYSLVNMKSSGEHILKLKFESDESSQLFAFTFGS